MASRCPHFGRIVVLLAWMVALLFGSAASDGYAAPLFQLGERADARAVDIRVATSGNDSTCRRGNVAKPCASLVRAYQIARCGDLVSIAAGSYPQQTIGHSTSGQNTDAKNCSTAAHAIVFKGQSRASVSIAGLGIGEPWVTVANVTLAGLAITGWDSSVGCYRNPVAHVTVSDSTIDARGAQYNPMYLANAQFITLSGNTIGNVVTGETEISNPGGPPCPHNDHLTFVGNTWHDFLNPGGAKDHMECLQFDALSYGSSNDHVTLKNNRFVNCGQYDVFISGPMNNWTVENNFFDRPCSKQAGTACQAPGGAISFSQNYTNVIGQFNVLAPGTFPQFSILPGTQSGGMWRYNISGSFPSTFHCGGQNRWTLIGNVDAGPAVCSSDTKADGRPRLVFLATSYRGRSFSASYGILSERQVRVRMTLYRGKTKLVATTGRLVDIYDSPVAFHWRNPKTVRPTRVCGRVFDSPGKSLAVACAPVTR